jgi:hypothetical protein
MAFILVASITLGAFLVGWRALATWWISRSS